jgi:aminomethyltransferase
MSRVMSETASQSNEPLQRTPLYDHHVALGARMVGFAGYEMPVQYKGGIVEEHLATRQGAGLFDISHMGEAHVIADNGQHATAARALETLVPADILDLEPGQQRYTQLLNSNGGTIDDLMVTRGQDGTAGGRLMLVLNAARKDVDCAHIIASLPAGVRLDAATDRALIALQGPKAGTVMAVLAPETEALYFMQAAHLPVAGIDCHVSRSGYTGEDGFEISVAADQAVALWDALSRFEGVTPCGLGARDSLRLEAGLCLYGHELDETTSPIEAGLLWSIAKRRRIEGGFPGFDRFQAELGGAVARRLVALTIDGRLPAREGAEILVSSGARAGVVTSGGFAPTLKNPIAMGYVSPEHASVGTLLVIKVRNNLINAKVVKAPFVAHSYRRKP